MNGDSPVCAQDEGKGKHECPTFADGDHDELRRVNRRGGPFIRRSLRQVIIQRKVLIEVNLEIRKILSDGQ